MRRCRIDGATLPAGSTHGFEPAEVPVGTSVSVADRLRYRFDNFMSRGGLSIFLALLTLFLGAFLVMGVIRVLASLLFADPAAGGLGEELWRTFIQVIDAGSIAEDGESARALKGVGILTVGVGLVLFSSLVAFITAEFDARLSQLRKGRSAVVEEGHTLLLGFGDRVVDIIRELIVANESEKRGAVVVLAEVEKDEMDDFFGDRIPERKTTEIITRSGSPSNLQTLRRMGIERARGVVILNPASAASSQEERARGDARVLKTIMGVVAATSDSGTPPLVAEFHGERTRALAHGVATDVLTTLDERAILAKLLVQTSRTSGLALVYANLVGFVGNEIYFFVPDGGWGGATFGELQFHFHDTVPIGFRTADGAIIINPLPDYQPADDTELIVLAEDDSTIGYVPRVVATSSVTAIPEVKATVGLEHHLLVGWSEKGALVIGEYAKFLPPGSAIDVLIPEMSEGVEAQLESLRAAYPNVAIHVVHADPHEPEELRGVRPEAYDNVVLLASEAESAEAMDAATIALLLRFRQHFREVEAASGQPVATQLISEVMDSDNIELVVQSGVKDFLISNQFVSKVFAQVSQEPDVMRVYDDLFQPEGSEIYIKSAGLYFADLPIEVRVADVMMAAQLRNEVCFGLKIAAEETDTEREFGVHIIPDREERFTLTAKDRLIVLAEDET